MTVSASASDLADLDADLLALFLPPDADAAALAGSFGGGAERAAGDAADGEPALVYPERGAARRLALVGLKGEPDRAEELRNAAARVAALATRLRARTVALALAGGSGPDEAAALTEGFVLGGYRFLEYKTEKPEGAVETLTVHAVEGAEGAVEAARVRAEAACLARDLVNLSPHAKTPELLAERVRLEGAKAGLRVEVWEEDRIREERMGGLLAVNRGSLDPPRFLVLEHRPEDARNERPVVLVGKAVVFDTGGLSLKPTKGSMDQMKADMAGGAAVVGALVAAARLRLPLHVVGLVPATDNRPGERAYVPGDVVLMRSGATVEVLNTDAEGRMLLADALDYAKALEPELVLDLATLTGAQRVALGDRVAAAFTPEGDGAAGRLAALDAAGRRTGEWVAPLPMHAHYADALKSDVADLKNVGGRDGGAITAAKFLEHFVREGGEPAYPWVHLDIAGPAFVEAPQPYRPKGGTGFGVRLLVELLQRRAEEG